MVAEIERLDGNSVLVNGEISGFHEIVLTDSRCQPYKNVITVALTPAQRSQLLEARKEQGVHRPDVRGGIVLRGVMSKDKGRLTPPTVVDFGDLRAKRQTAPEVLIIVSEISEVEIVQYEPEDQ